MSTYIEQKVKITLICLRPGGDGAYQNIYIKKK